MIKENAKPIISFKNINKLFNKTTILHNLNLDIYEGEIIALLGKSGCGKSTLLKILIGFYPPDKGHIFYNEKNITKNFKEIRQISGFVSQENSFYEKLTVLENLSFFAKLYNVSSKDIKNRSEYLLDMVNLKHAKNILASNISGGMKRRLEFAISLIHNPKILILDEPLTGLDIEIRDELWKVIKDIRKSGVTIIISTHLLSSAQKHATRVAILNNYSIQKDFILNNNHRDTNSFSLENKFLEVINK